MKKKILIVSHAMELGGAERALLGILENIDTDMYQVDLFLLRHQGELLQCIPQNIHLLPEVPEYSVLGRPMTDTLKEGHLLLTGARIYGKYRAKLYEKKRHLTNSAVAIEYSHKYIKNFLPDIQRDVEYDMAISFLTPHYFVTEKVRAKCKIAWIHTDYSTIQVDIDSEFKMWKAYDYIASISESVTQSFLRTFPGLKNKIVLIENILPEKLISRQAKAIVADGLSKENTNLLSVGRFSNAKNFDNIPDICSKIAKERKNVKWYLIGYGGDEKMIRKRINECAMENHVILLGKKENPYPYIKQCDIYIQPSRYEGKCVAVREAQMLGKPVVITAYATSGSQLEDGVDGVIVPLNNDECAREIIKVIDNQELQKKLIQNMTAREYTNAKEIYKIYDLMP